MKQLSKIVAAALVAAGAVSSANAALLFNGDYGTGPQSYIGAYNGASFDSGFFDNSTLTANPLVVGSSFSNTWAFSFTPGGQIAINANFIPTSSISNFTVTLYKASWTSAPALPNVNTATTPVGFALGTMVTSGVPLGAQSNIDFTVVPPGQYAFVVTGTVKSGPSLYSGQLTTTNLPEPSSLALVGLALVGAGAALRKRKAA